MGSFTVEPKASRKKLKKCPYFTSRKDGKWTKMVCSLPEGQSCPDKQCQATPGYQEPDPDAGD